MNVPIMRGQERTQRAKKASTARNRQLASDEEDEEVEMTAAPPAPTNPRKSGGPKPKPVAANVRSRGAKANKPATVVEESSDEQGESGVEAEVTTGTQTQTFGRSQRNKSQAQP